MRSATCAWVTGTILECLLNTRQLLIQGLRAQLSRLCNAVYATWASMARA